MPGPWKSTHDKTPWSLLSPPSIALPRTTRRSQKSRSWKCWATLRRSPESIRSGVRNNLGGHANHTMFWEIMGPNGGKPEGEVLAAIDRDPRRPGEVPD